jgi:4a-hydroxytetrahydrobiopterin dehydratase
MSLHQEHCQPLSGSEHRISASQADELSRQIPQWDRDEQGRLRRRYSFANFLDALAFTNRLGDIAEAQGHHPDLELGWGYVVVHLTTHDVDGLSRNDFIMAARIDSLASATPRIDG